MVFVNFRQHYSDPSGTFFSDSLKIFILSTVPSICNVVYKIQRKIKHDNMIYIQF